MVLCSQVMCLAGNATFVNFSFLSFLLENQLFWLDQAYNGIGSIQLVSLTVKPQYYTVVQLSLFCFDHCSIIL